MIVQGTCLNAHDHALPRPQQLKQKCWNTNRKLRYQMLPKNNRMQSQSSNLSLLDTYIHNCRSKAARESRSTILKSFCEQGIPSAMRQSYNTLETRPESKYYTMHRRYESSVLEAFSYCRPKISITPIELKEGFQTSSVYIPKRTNSANVRYASKHQTIEPRYHNFERQLTRSMRKQISLNSSMY